MRIVLVLLGVLSAVIAAPLGASGPVKISDNNIENIFNININIQGVFTNNIEQDIVKVVVGLLNQQQGQLDGDSLKDKLMALASSTDSRNLDLNVPVNALGQNFSFDGLANKIQEAIAKKSSDSKDDKDEGSSFSSLQKQARDLVQNYMNSSS